VGLGPGGGLIEAGEPAAAARAEEHLRQLAPQARPGQAVQELRGWNAHGTRSVYNNLARVCQQKAYCAGGEETRPRKFRPRAGAPD
jgi:hypothetical protein